MTESVAMFWLTFGMAAGSVVALSAAHRLLEQARERERRWMAMLEEAKGYVEEASATVKGVQEACALYSLGAREEALELLARIKTPEGCGP